MVTLEAGNYNTFRFNHAASKICKHALRPGKYSTWNHHSILNLEWVLIWSIIWLSREEGSVTLTSIILDDMIGQRKNINAYFFHYNIYWRLTCQLPQEMSCPFISSKTWCLTIFVGNGTHFFSHFQDK